MAVGKSDHLILNLLYLFLQKLLLFKLTYTVYTSTYSLHRFIATQETLFSLIKVLFQYASRNLPKYVGPESCLQTIKDDLKQELGIEGEVVLQKYNHDWSEWVDITNVSDIQDKDKIKLVNIPSASSSIISNVDTGIKNINTEGEI